MPMTAAVELDEHETDSGKPHTKQVFQICASAHGDQSGLGDSIMMQAFGWDSCRQHSSFYEYVQGKVPELQAAGVSHLWLPPPSHSVSPEGYMPGQLYNLSSAYGSQGQLQALIAALKAAGISPIADIVINHRCADDQDEGGRWNRYRDNVPHAGPSIAWGSWAIAPDAAGLFGGAGHAEPGGVAWLGAPNLDHSNATVREGLVAWLQYLHSTVGFAGWRFDHAIGYSSKYVQTYVDRTTTQAALCVGEVWVDMDWCGASLAANQDAARSTLCAWVDGCGRRASVFDFVTKGVLQEAVRRTQYWRLRDAQGQAAGLIGWWPGASITFVENHDTGSSQQHFPFPPDRLGVGYAYILTHPGIPCVFWEHFFSSEDPQLHHTIDALIQVRRRHRITATSSLLIVAAEDDLYVASIGGLMVKLGPRYDMGHHLPDEAHWQQVVSGPDFCVWEARNSSSSSS